MPSMRANKIHKLSFMVLPGCAGGQRVSRNVVTRLQTESFTAPYRRNRTPADFMFP
jgi:hypothetical protein